jgi:hypothetical protein
MILVKMLFLKQYLLLILIERLEHCMLMYKQLYSKGKTARLDNAFFLLHQIAYLLHLIASNTSVSFVSTEEDET